MGKKKAGRTQKPAARRRHTNQRHGLQPEVRDGPRTGVSAFASAYLLGNEGRSTRWWPDDACPWRDGGASSGESEVALCFPYGPIHCLWEESPDKLPSTVSPQEEWEQLAEAGCEGKWDNLTCWKPAVIGETVTVPCPKMFGNFFSKPGNISKNCTAKGWSKIFPNIISACGFNANVSEDKLTFFLVVKAFYTLGHSLSLIALIIGSAVLCIFRKLHCTRNYIHLNLFFSFILKAISVFIKDHILYSESNSNMQCLEQEPSLLGCKAVMVIFQYCVMANFFWLLVEGLYLHTLLVIIFSENRHFIVYLLIGWGIPLIFVTAWTLTKLYLEDTGCWDTKEGNIPWWIIRGPIIISIIVNFIVFISIIRILMQKLSSPDVGGNDQSQYKRLTKSTLLLIPLFGVHYIIFISQPDDSMHQIIFELAIGSFQGLVVAVLYCFLNSEVQCELKRKWRSICLNQYVGRDYRLHSSSISRNGSESKSHFHRNSRAQSFLQTETSVV